MGRIIYVIGAILCFFLTAGLTGCSGKHVRHLASDVCMVTPGVTTKQEVVNYMGQPDTEYKLANGDILWVYYEGRADMLRKAPYIGEKIGKENYEIVKVTFNGDNVKNVDFETMKEEEFKQSGLAE